MASTCVNSVGMSPDNFLDCPPLKFPSYAGLSPRIPFSREISDEVVGIKTSEKHRDVTGNADSVKQEHSDPVDFVDFEFRLEDWVTMLPADELFADGKLVPLQLSAGRQPMTIAPRAPSDIILPDTPVFRRRNEISPADPFLFSPKAPRCSSRWKELLGMRKLYQNSMAKQEDQKTAGSLSSSHTNRNAARSLKQFLHRSTKPSVNAQADSSLNIPLLKEMDNESVSISSRISLSSSSSGHEHDDLPRLSLDSDKPRAAITRNTRQPTRNISRVRVVKPKGLSSENPRTTRVIRNVTHRAPETTTPVSGVAVDSPRMNSSGKIVFHNLERRSSSPSSFNCGSRYKHHGMERSYSANVRVTPVLNVPVCSLRGSSKSGVFGFPMFSSQPKKAESCSCNGGVNKTQKNHNKNRTDRI
ncbi:uncharacterized protein LOC142517613 [Primulina tabacum]|uniref:uncharacterized protein LOC142517613 n=1 Tax=Primulina tabacum TaxID=48773 RepID=UPI003F5A9131